ncbi:hypothetical protein C8Q76DRAFT_617118 [Earliella scabrosa]|nr:hypothetical protein C8Q76DRAFT_617118 [Earliella scabrosa]
MSRRRGNYKFDGGDYLPHLQKGEFILSVPRPRLLEDDITDRVCDNLVSLLRQWLKYPNNTEMLAAYSIIYILDAFKNSDVLLLDGVWAMYRSSERTLPGGPDLQPGLDAILQFALQLLPLARGENLSQPNQLQQLAQKRPDHILPWRELAPCRRRVTAPGGPFHPTLVEQPGAFPSWVIFRALLFDSPILHSGATSCYFANQGAWEDFLTSEGFNVDDPTSVRRFFNIACYGTPQNERSQGDKLAPQYFAAETRWLELASGKPVIRRIEHLRLLGGLTGYLLTADLVYAGKVAEPNVEEIGRVIHANRLGSYAALVSAKLVSKTCNADEVVQAFREVYNHLLAGLDQADRELVGYNAILVEHLLCKFQRTRKVHKLTS